MKKFILYLVRWQLSSPVLALCMWWFEPIGVIWATIVANFIGGCIFYFVDKSIFNGERGEKK